MVYWLFEQTLERLYETFFEFLKINSTFAAVKWLLHHKRCVSYLLVVLLWLSASSRLLLTHDKEYNEAVWQTEERAAESGEWVDCNCIVCSSDHIIATEAKAFEYHPFTTTLHYEYGVLPTAQANGVVVVTSLRGPPALS